MIQVDLIIRNGYVVTMNDEMEIFENGSVVINDIYIQEVGPVEKMDERYYSENVIDATGKIIMPGLINGHTHIPMTYFRGLADDLPLQAWLENHIWPIEKEFVKPEFVYDAALHGSIEMIRNGITMFNDQYYHGKEIAQAALKAGIRCILGEGIIDFPVANYIDPQEIMNYSIRKMKDFAKYDTIEFSISPHSVYTVCEKNLRKVRDIAEEYQMLIHIHMSETRQEVEETIRNHGKRPVHYVNDLGLLDLPVIFAHGVWIDEEEQKLMASKNVSVAINTESNMKLASGFAPVKDYMKNGVNLCLGTDGVASNNNLSLFEELDTTAKIHKALNLDPTILPAKEAIKMVTINGAKALHKEDKLGSLVHGKLADVITIKNDSLENIPMFNVYSHLVYTINSASVQDSVINGKIVMKDRILPQINESSMIEKANYYIDRINEFRGREFE